ncbi:MAG TPA: hypothetical protein VFB30_13570, partial [Spirochaetia bacterium]|nr:hypothetical protein [Spirochaetia bacterium]
MENKAGSLSKLTVKLEIFTNLILVPFTQYFLAMVALYQAKGELEFVTTYSALFTVLNVIVHIVIRHAGLGRTIRTLYSRETTLSREELTEIKRKLLNHPFSEALIIALRWIVGISAVYVLVGVTYGFELIRAVVTVTVWAI